MRTTRQILKDLIRRLRWHAKPVAPESDRAIAPIPDEHVDVLANMDGLRSELSQFRQQDEQQLQDLQQRVGHLESERDIDRRKLVTLRTELDAAVARLKDNKTHTSALETHIRDLDAKSTVTLQEVLVRERRLRRHLNIAMTVASASFLLATVLGITTFRATQNTSRILAEIHTDTQAMRDVITTIQPHKPSGSRQ